MRKGFIVILAVCLLAALAGCSGGAQTQVSPGATPTPPPTPTPGPDFSSEDFTGHWKVSSVTDAAGEPVTGTALTALQADFVLELADGGIYFVYDGAGTVLGQGTYAVDKVVITLTAADATTVYQIEDADTLVCTTEDKSVTVMSRQAEEIDEEVPVDEGDIEDTGEDAGAAVTMDPEATTDPAATETPSATPAATEAPSATAIPSATATPAA